MPSTTLEGNVGGTAPGRVAVLRALNLGDLLCAVPALRAMRRAWPQADIALIGLPWARDFAGRYSALLDRFIEFPGAPGLPEQPFSRARLDAFREAMRREDFDLVIQMQGDGTITNELVRGFGARETAGFCLDGHQPPDGRYSVYPENLSEVLRWILLMARLGIRPRGDQIEFPIQPQEQAEGDSVLAEAGLAGRGFVCLHPGARAPERRWPPARFASVADALADSGLRVVVTGHGDEECEIAGRVKSASRASLVDLAGRTSLGGVAEILRRSRLLVCNDTGISHLAAALQVPSVIVFRTTDPVRWAPLDGRRHRVVVDGNDTLSHVLREAGDLLEREAFRAA